MSGTVPVPMSYTVDDAASDLVRLELSSTGSVLGTDWRTASSVMAMLRGREHNRELSDYGTVVTALEYLADRGIATREIEDWEVRASRPQRYRRARVATAEVLARFAEPVGKCGRIGCKQRAKGASRFCSKACGDKVRLGSRK